MMIYTNEYVYSKRSYKNETGTHEKLLQRAAKSRWEEEQKREKNLQRIHKSKTKVTNQNKMFGKQRNVCILQRTEWSVRALSFPLLLFVVSHTYYLANIFPKCTNNTIAVNLCGCPVLRSTQPFTYFH